MYVYEQQKIIFLMGKIKKKTPYPLVNETNPRILIQIKMKTIHNIASILIYSLCVS